MEIQELNELQRIYRKALDEQHEAERVYRKSLLPMHIEKSVPGPLPSSNQFPKSAKRLDKLFRLWYSLFHND